MLVLFVHLLLNGFNTLLALTVVAQQRCPQINNFIQGILISIRGLINIF